MNNGKHLNSFPAVSFVTKCGFLFHLEQLLQQELELILDLISRG